MASRAALTVLGCSNVYFFSVDQASSTISALEKLSRARGQCLLANVSYEMLQASGVLWHSQTPADAASLKSPLQLLSFSKRLGFV